jgi:hypothetical protein
MGTGRQRELSYRGLPLSDPPPLDPAGPPQMTLLAHLLITCASYASDGDHYDNLIGHDIATLLRSSQLVVASGAATESQPVELFRYDGGAVDGRRSRHTLSDRLFGSVSSNQLYFFQVSRHYVDERRPAIWFAGPHRGLCAYSSPSICQTTSEEALPSSDTVTLAFPGSYLFVADDGTVVFPTEQPACVADGSFVVCSEGKRTTLAEVTTVLQSEAERSGLLGHVLRMPGMPDPSSNEALVVDASGQRWLSGEALGMASSSRIVQMQRELAAERPHAHQARAARRVKEVVDDPETYRALGTWRHRENLRVHQSEASKSMVELRGALTRRRYQLAARGVPAAWLHACLRAEERLRATRDLGIDDQAARDLIVAQVMAAHELSGGELLDEATTALVEQLERAESASLEPHAPMP